MPSSRIRTLIAVVSISFVSLSCALKEDIKRAQTGDPEAVAQLEARLDEINSSLATLGTKIPTVAGNPFDVEAWVLIATALGGLGSGFFGNKVFDLKKRKKTAVPA